MGRSRSIAKDFAQVIAKVASLFILLSATQRNSPAQTPTSKTATSSELRDLVVQESGCGKASTLDDKSDPGGLIRNEIIKPTQRNIYEAYLKFIPPNGRPPKNEKSYTRVHFTLLPEAKLGAVGIDSSSGIEAEDKAAFGAIVDAKLVSFPASAKLHSLTLHMTFTVNMTCEEVLAEEARSAHSDEHAPHTDSNAATSTAKPHKF